MHHPVRVDERDSSSELLDEGANLAFRESPAINDPVEKRVGLGTHDCRYARPSSLLEARAHLCTACTVRKRSRFSDYIMQRSGTFFGPAVL